MPKKLTLEAFETLVDADATALIPLIITRDERLRETLRLKRLGGRYSPQYAAANVAWIEAVVAFERAAEPWLARCRQADRWQAAGILDGMPARAKHGWTA